MTPQQLTERERYPIKALNTEGYTPTKIVRLLGRLPSTIYRELTRNRDAKGYRGSLAIKRIDKRRYQAKKSEKPL